MYAAVDAQIPRGQRITVALGDRSFTTAGRDFRPWHRLLFTPADRSAFASWRYTNRHAAAGMRELLLYWGQASSARALGSSLEKAGFHLGQDIYAPLWGSGVRFGDDMPYRASAYRDCSVHQPSIGGFYPYRSKVCRVPLRVYRWLSAQDPLLRAIQAIHVLNRHHDPNYRYSDLDHRNLTPSKTAQSLERAWGPTGIPQCSPFGCEDRWVSAVRTATFGTLETILGYQYGDPDSRAWADAAARTLLRVQVDHEGWMEADGRRYYRPLNAGGFYTVWDSEFQNSQSFSFFGEFLREELLEPLNMPPEFTGVIPSNAETTIAAVAFLARYRCQRYGVGCGTARGFGPPLRPRRATRETGRPSS
jgi:hypothetical protein